jgi:formylmethanofuran dehydrogenase subunit C
MNGLSLRLTHDPGVELDARSISSELFALGRDDVRARPLKTIGGRATILLGDLFDIDDAPPQHLQLAGDLRRFHGIGTGWSAGALRVDGPVGDAFCSGMSGGTATLAGSARSRACQQLRGGSVTIDGNVGDDLGAPYVGRVSGMSGGSVLVRGTAGRYAGFRMRRGTILILGDCEGGLGLEMVAGTLIVGGSANGEVGASMNRGTIILGHPAEFSEICFTRPRECRLGIARLIADQLPEEAASIAKMLRGPIWRRLGDLSAGGKGEIWTGVNA